MMIVTAAVMSRAVVTMSESLMYYGLIMGAKYDEVIFLRYTGSFGKASFSTMKVGLEKANYHACFRAVRNLLVHEPPINGECEEIGQNVNVIKLN